MVSVMLEGLRNELKKEIRQELLIRDVRIENVEKDIKSLKSRMSCQEKEKIILNKYLQDLQ
jgi:hypothetical protein